VTSGLFVQSTRHTVNLTTCYWKIKVRVTTDVLHADSLSPNTKPNTNAYPNPYLDTLVTIVIVSDELTM